MGVHKRRNSIVYAMGLRLLYTPINNLGWTQSCEGQQQWIKWMKRKLSSSRFRCKILDEFLDIFFSETYDNIIQYNLVISYLWQLKLDSSPQDEFAIQSSTI